MEEGNSRVQRGGWCWLGGRLECRRDSGWLNPSGWYGEYGITSQPAKEQGRSLLRRLFWLGECGTFIQHQGCINFRTTIVHSYTIALHNQHTTTITMSIARRLFSTTVERLNVLADGQAPTHISTADLPPTIYTLIARHIAQSEPSTSYSIPNPFLTHRAVATTEVPEVSTSHQHTPRAISRRREKQLLEHYPDFVLPPSKLNPLSTTPTIRWNDGQRDVEIVWTGELGDLKPKSLYGSRKRMFKGHKHERERPERERETQERMQGMDKRINDWRSVSCTVCHRHPRVCADNVSLRQKQSRRQGQRFHSSLMTSNLHILPIHRIMHVSIPALREISNLCRFCTSRSTHSIQSRMVNDVSRCLARMRSASAVHLIGTGIPDNDSLSSGPAVQAHSISHLTAFWCTDHVTDWIRADPQTSSDEKHGSTCLVTAP